MATQGRKSAKRPPKAVIITVIVIVLVIAITLVVIYFAAPNVWNKLTASLMGNKENNSNSTPKESTLVRGDGALQFHMVDIGQGDFLVIILPDGKEMVIDAGSTSGGSKETVLNYLSTIVDGHLDYLVLTHTDQDHVSYMDDILGAYDVDNIYMPALYATHSSVAEANIPASKTKILDDSGVDATKCYVDTKNYAEFYIAAFKEDCNIYLNLELNEDNDDTILDEHSVITSADNTYSITFFFMDLAFYNKSKFDNGPRKNGISPTMILEYNGKRIVLTGDANELNEPILTQKMNTYYGGVIDCDVIKVAHHGSHEGSSPEYLNEVKCEYAMVSCGAGNGYNHPRQVALTHLQESGVTTLYRTDMHGTTTCVIDKNGGLIFTPTNTNVSQEAAWVGLPPPTP